MAATNVRYERGAKQFQGVFSPLFVVTATIDFGSVADGDSVSDTITVPGVAVGDIVLGLSLGLDRVKSIASAYVSAADTITVVVSNLETAALD